MHREFMEINGRRTEIVRCNTVVVGTGAAGFQASVQLKSLGQPDVAIVTEGVGSGTSRNTGSDKQTYYKLTLSGDVPDSPMAMARDLFAGKCVDGDTALVEAALSVPCFLNLQRLGVPFPVNRYGEFVGYKTDHDPRARATSAGPLTSHMMTEALEREAARLDIPILDGFQVLEILKCDGKAAGLFTLNKNKLEDEDGRFCLFNCANIVYATGGPAGIYADRVYPVGHFGGSGAAFRAGVKGKNLTEWQFGLASTAPRWNVSGTYMQVLPRMVSVDSEGNEYEFLDEYFRDEGKMLSLLFQKGYEWPFDTAKLPEGSSLIDLLVYREGVLFGRKVYLDFLHNPGMRNKLDFSVLNGEARHYLDSAGACFGTPIARLQRMNAPAIELYASKGVDLTRDYLPIALCAQHNNGGLDTDMWWQTNLPGLYAAGEVAGTHGVTRPGGSALNAGQAGGMRAAQHIAAHGGAEPLPDEVFAGAAAKELERHYKMVRTALLGGTADNAETVYEECARQMTAVGGAIRDGKKLAALLTERAGQVKRFPQGVGINSAAELPAFYRLYDVLLSQWMYLTAMRGFIEDGGGSRGSALYYDPNGSLPEGLEELFRFAPDGGERDGQVLETAFDGESCRNSWRPVRPLPEEGGGFFENVWREYRKHKNVY